MLTRYQLITIFIARVFLFLPFMVVAGCIPVLIDEWNIGAANIGTIISGFFLAYACSLTAFSYLSGVIGAKRSVQISALSTALSSAAFGLFASDFLSTFLLYSLIGLCQGGVYTPLIALFRDNVPSDNLGSAIGWLISSTSIGYAASISLTGIGLGIDSWRLAFLLTGSLTAVGSVVLLRSIKSLDNVIHLTSKDRTFFGQLSKNRPAKTLLAGYCAHNWELIGMWSWAPSIITASFVLSGTSTANASQWSAQFVMVLHLCGAIAASTMGALSDRVGRRMVLLWTALIATILSFSVGWTVTFSPVLVAGLMIIYAFFALGDSPVLSTALAEKIEPALLGPVLALRSLLGFIVAAIAPVTVGLVIDTLVGVGFSDTVVWGTAFGTLGLGGALAFWCAMKISKDF